MSEKVVDDMQLKNTSKVEEAKTSLQLNNKPNQQVSGEPSQQLSEEPRREDKMQVDGKRTSEQSLNLFNEKQMEQGEVSHLK